MGMATRFEAAKLRPTGRTSRGVYGMRLREGDRIADMNVLSRNNNSNSVGGDGEEGKEEYVLVVTSSGYGKLVSTAEFTCRGRGGMGVIAIKFKSGSQDDRISCLRIVKKDDEILVITAKGIMVRQKVSMIPSQGRSATGVTVQRLDDGDSISSVSIVPIYEETD
jgi:DNA gyrase subunit A